MAHYDIFRDQLGIKYPAFGHALWEPNPGRYTPVEVGDVGFIREGKFHRLFNTLLPADHPSHERFGVPEHYEPLLPGVADHIDSGTLGPNDFCSFGVHVSSGGLEMFASEPVGIAEVSFSCSRKGGAVLSLPVTAQREDTIARGDFSKWIIRHVDTWLAFARRLGLGVEKMGDIVLVTGRHRTRSWTNVAFFEGQANAQVSFGVQITNDVSTRVNWQVSREHVQGAMLCKGPSGSDLPEDQCIFVRGYRVARTLKIFPRIRGAADKAPDPGGSDCEPELEVVSFPIFTEYRDPLHALLDYFTENLTWATQRAPGCDFVLVHDDDLDRIRRIGDWNSLETLQPDAVVGYLQRSEPEIAQVACGISEAKGSIVAMFSEESRSWASEVSSRAGMGPFPGGSSTLFFPVILKPRLTLPWEKTDAQRKYIELINQTTSMWANWDLSKVIQIGDFGTINKKTGELKVDGNIFTHPEIKHIARDYPAFEAVEPDLNHIHSQQVKRLDVRVDVAGTTTDNGLAVLKTRWQFNKKRGAILLMHEPRLICVPDGFFDEKIDLPILKRKVVVEQVYNCPGFYTYLSSKAGEQVSVSLRSATSASADSDRTLASIGWSAVGATGVSQQAFREDAVYTPLFRLKSYGRRQWR